MKEVVQKVKDWVAANKKVAAVIFFIVLVGMIIGGVSAQECRKPQSLSTAPIVEYDESIDWVKFLSVMNENMLVYPGTAYDHIDVYQNGSPYVAFVYTLDGCVVAAFPLEASFLAKEVVEYNLKVKGQPS